MNLGYHGSVAVKCGMYINTWYWTIEDWTTSPSLHFFKQGIQSIVLILGFLFLPVYRTHRFLPRISTWRKSCNTTDKLPWRSLERCHTTFIRKFRAKCVHYAQLWFSYVLELGQGSVSKWCVYKGIGLDSHSWSCKYSVQCQFCLS